MGKDLITFMIGWLLSLCVVALFMGKVIDSYFYTIPKSKWKCNAATIINDDPSNTECSVYRRKDTIVNP